MELVKLALPISEWYRLYFVKTIIKIRGSLVAQTVKNFPAMQETLI